MEPPNYLRLIAEGLVRDGQKLQAFVKKSLELQRMYGDLPPESPEATEFQALLHERHVFAHRWYREHQRQWEKTDALVSTLLANQMARWQQSLDTDLAELWKSRPQDE